MADTTKTSDKKLGVTSKTTLTLKPRVETGTVRQSFPHGRTKQVVVEKRGKRRIGGDAEPAHAAPEPDVAKAAPVTAKAPLGRPAASPPPADAARVSALADARVREQEERRIAEEEAKRRASREGIEQAEREAAEARRRAE